MQGLSGPAAEGWTVFFLLATRRSTGFTIENNP